MNVRVESAGTEPDPTVPPAVAAHLTRQGYSIPVTKPRNATTDEVAAADVVISIGCDVSVLPARRGQFAMNKMKAWQGSYGVSDHGGILGTLGIAR